MKNASRSILLRVGLLASLYAPLGCQSRDFDSAAETETIYTVGKDTVLANYTHPSNSNTECFIEIKLKKPTDGALLIKYWKDSKNKEFQALLGKNYSVVTEYAIETNRLADSIMASQEINKSEFNRRNLGRGGLIVSDVDFESEAVALLRNRGSNEILVRKKGEKGVKLEALNIQEDFLNAPDFDQRASDVEINALIKLSSVVKQILVTNAKKLGKNQSSFACNQDSRVITNELLKYKSIN